MKKVINLKALKTEDEINLDEECKVVAVEKNSSSERQGVKSNDIIIKINDEEINGDRDKALELIHQKGVGTMLLTLKRGKEEVLFFSFRWC